MDYISNTTAQWDRPAAPFRKELAMDYEYDIIVYIGRFQPFHVGHRAVLDTALTKAKRVVVVLGSANCARSPKNPFTHQERAAMISAAYAGNERIVFVPQEDHLYNFDRWLTEVAAKVSGVANHPWTPGPIKIGIIGVDKDHTSFYLRHFPQWEAIPFKPERLINATDIRRVYFGVLDNLPLHDGMNELPPAIIGWLNSFHNQQAQTYNFIADEWRFIDGYKEQWKSAPYPPTFLTADALVTQAGHVLMVARAAEPGRGLLALPGGFVDQSETMREAALRELKEETQIRVPSAVLEGRIVGEQTFDSPERSQRGRTVTHVVHITLDEDKLPKVRGGDDARSARWVPLADLRRDQTFEDHYDIIETMTGI
ncbi:MAG: bifunctional nicotinamide-nucleotide adenylyltransferase/Nudix hydroxylase [Hyphomicrobiaceae bacterium]